MTIQDFESTLNNWGQERVPFLFLVDFEMKKPVAIPLKDVDDQSILYNINGITNHIPQPIQKTISLSKYPVSLQAYERKFDIVHRHLAQGDSYLTNLTVKTRIETSSSLREIYQNSKAKYKLLFRNEFLVFSPEIFIQIKNNRIYSFPMKGTINAVLPDALTTILNDPKELAEHITIVDLIRNDLSQVAKDVEVTRFRYADTIYAGQQQLLQLSSEIVGTLAEPFSMLGTTLIKLLPAGSVTGAPKNKTVDIIRQAEGEERGYYTGIVGVFDGESLDSGVMIRYIENKNGELFYRSGGGITTQSECNAEYQEAIDKIYVPVN
jgi:para-aminobenzoate synthetase component I